MIGRRLSHYEIVDEISRGGMGIVYRGVDVNLGREVAIKVLPEDLLGDPGRRSRLLQEARAASSLEHPHIAVIHEVGDAGDVTFIAMELIRGEKLSDVIARGPLTQSRALTLASEIAEGLARAHEKGVVHRDLKPSNVMVTDDGHAKIIDFGLAKTVEPLSADGVTASVGKALTSEGAILGTAAYMSPEQARGARIDHRTDIFALGVTLYEMLTGRPAFQGRSGLDTLQAILMQPVPPLSAAAGSSGDTTAELQRIIAKCTAKDAEDRYQGMKDLVVDLRAARRRLESSEEYPRVSVPAGTGSRARAPLGSTAKTALGLALGLAIVVPAAYWWLRQESTPRVMPSGKPAVAVLYFENNTGDASLDWMRTGLTDMLVTDLSQSSDFEVMGTDRLVQILQDLNRADDRAVSADVVREIAERARVDNVLVGSYVKAGGIIRISARLQDARTGRIMTSERVEGPGDATLFQLVDDLTRRFKTTMTTLVGSRPGTLVTAPGEKPVTGLDRGLTEVTTSSIEAYRYYAEGLSFHERNLSAQAIPLLEKAVETDPEFAMAYAKLAVVNNNLANMDKAEEYGRKAIDRIDRLTPRERYYIEGFYYGLRPETRARSIDAYKKGLALHPEHQASRHNLALKYLELERYPDAIAEHEEILRRGTSNAATYENFIEVLLDAANIRRAEEISSELLRAQPDNAVAHRGRALIAVAAGRPDEARAAFQQAMALNPLDFRDQLGPLSLALLQERWDEAARLSDAMIGSPSPFLRFLGQNGSLQTAMARGRGRAASEAAKRAAAIPGLPAQLRAAARTRLGAILLRQGNVREALGHLDAALVDARNRNAEFQTLQFLALGQNAAGQHDASRTTLETLEARARALATDHEIRRVHWVRGEIALGRGDLQAAVQELVKAQSLLPPHGPFLGPPTSHMEFELSAAVANLRAGNDKEASRLLERIQGRYERVWNMEPWARSFYLLGQVYERRGDMMRARQQYKRFVELWGDGDLERGWVEDARRKTAG